MVFFGPLLDPLVNPVRDPLGPPYGIPRSGLDARTAGGPAGGPDGPRGRRDIRIGRTDGRPRRPGRPSRGMWIGGGDRERRGMYRVQGASAASGRASEASRKDLLISLRNY